MKWKSIKQIELIPVVVVSCCCKWDTLVAFLSVVFTLCRLINTIHPHLYWMATCVCLHIANLLDWKLVKCAGISANQRISMGREWKKVRTHELAKVILFIASMDHQYISWLKDTDKFQCNIYFARMYTTISIAVQWNSFFIQFKHNDKVHVSLSLYLFIER